MIAFEAYVVVTCVIKLCQRPSTSFWNNFISAHGWSYFKIISQAYCI